MSSFSLAFADCKGTFALAAENFRCQRPVWLSYGFWFFIVLGFGLGIFAFLRLRSRGAST
jgi:hypothetical protein